MSAAEWAVAGFLGAWWIASVLAQLPSMLPLRKQLRGLLPYWYLFAPRPVRRDLHLLYRDRLPDGSMTEWAELPIRARRGPGVLLFNPEQRADYAQFTSLRWLMRSTLAEGQVAERSLGYLMILRRVAALPHAALADATQFLVLLSKERGGEMRVVHLSKVHPL